MEYLQKKSETVQNSLTSEIFLDWMQLSGREAPKMFAYLTMVQLLISQNWLLGNV